MTYETFVSPSGRAGVISSGLDGAGGDNAHGDDSSSKDSGETSHCSYSEVIKGKRLGE